MPINKSTDGRGRGRGGKGRGRGALGGCGGIDRAVGDGDGVVADADVGNEVNDCGSDAGDYCADEFEVGGIEIDAHGGIVPMEKHVNDVSIDDEIDLHDENEQSDSRESVHVVPADVIRNDDHDGCVGCTSAGAEPTPLPAPPDDAFAGPN